MSDSLNIVALSPIQEGMLYHTLERDDDVYLTNFSIDLKGSIDLIRLNKAWDRVVAEHPSLRTVYRWKGINQPVQVILTKKRNTFEIRDIESIHSEKGTLNLRLVPNEIDLENDPIKVFVYRINEEKYTFHIQYHHILMDGWSLGILLNDLFKYYDNLDCIVSDSVFNYEEYINHLNNVKGSDQSINYWKSTISKDASTTIPSVVSVSDEKSHIESTDFHLKDELFNRLECYCKNKGFTLANVIYASWSILLAKYNDSSNVCFGTTVSGRDNSIDGIVDSVGLYIQTPPLCIDNISRSNSLYEIINKVKDVTLDREAHKEFPLVDIQSFHKSRQLFDTIVVIENFPLSKRINQLPTSTEVLSYSIEEKTNFDICLEVNLLKCMNFRLSYNSEKFSGFVIKNILRHLHKLLRLIVENDELSLDKLCFLDEKEYQKLVIDFNNQNRVPLCHSHLLDAWFEVVVHRSDRVAIRQKDCQVTYLELDLLSDNIAYRLQTRGIKSQDLVAIKRQADVMTIAILIAVVKLGAVYVPIDPSTPEERVNKILSNGIKYIITEEEFEFSSDLTEPCHWLRDKEYASDDLLYTIFTSGSTGEPKGVMIEHRTIMNYIQWAMGKYQRAKYSAIYPLFTSLAFDLTVTSIWCPLLSGGEVNIVNQPIFNALKDVAQTEGLTNIKMTPSQLRLLNQLQKKETSCLNTIVLGGEQLDSQLCREVTNNLSSEVRIYNEYGPTEATVGCMIWQYEYGSDAIVVPIGVPIDNARIYILDRFMQPQPPGIPGELYIGGDVLARGYLGKEDLTEEKFLDNPFEPGRMYKTGDLAFFNERGVIEYIGRIDNQVKLRGYRVELDEIAAKIKAFDGCSNAVVTIKELNGEEQLIAYCVSQPGINDVQLRSYLAEHLPAYMVPAIFHFVDDIKLTSNGKVDFTSLPEVKLESKFIMTENSIYKTKILEVFSSILGTKVIDCNISFFDLGANSLSLLRITNMLNTFLPVKLKIVDFFTYPNVNSLIEYLESDGSKIASSLNDKDTKRRRNRMESRRNKMKSRMAYND
ncbi:non-ribosomal peptide synthetase [Vibrio proteolyticus]